MTDDIQFFVKGEPKGQPRPRAFARRVGDKFIARVYDAGTAEGWKSQIAIAAKPFLPESPILGAVGITITFNMPRPMSHYRTGKNEGQLKPDAPWFCTGKPDFDNLVKAVLDALTTLGMWMDDKQVVIAHVTKYYALRGQEGADIEIFRLEGKTSLKQPPFLETHADKYDAARERFLPA